MTNRQPDTLVCIGVGGLCCLTPLLTIFQLYLGDESYWWRRPEYPEKTTDMSQVTLKHWEQETERSTETKAMNTTDPTKHRR